jgi:NAD(P)-dependent dehydrogenase (short-subunit alcohol dehydrogenase family)
MAKIWTIADIPSQAGKLAIVTGANGGLGYETALALAGASADVIVAARSEAKGQEAVEKIRALSPGAKVSFGHLDLASLASVAEFARKIAGEHPAVDLLVNNAGVMSPPKRQTTADGFELQFGVNYLGHFALTEHLLPLLRRGREPRIVNLSSLAHRGGALHFDDLQWERRYRPWPAYSQSKLAMLMFAFELQRRSDAGGWGLMSNAAHPGYSRTDLIANGPGADGALAKIGAMLQPFFSQSAAAGALPSLFAATAPEAKGGGYYGPKGFYELKGPATSAYVAPQAKDADAAKRLWEVSERLTGVRFEETRAAA